MISNKSREILSLFNENKLLILKSIYLCNENVCGCNLVEELSIPKNLVSYHIKTLREKGYIEEVKCGKNKKYKITAKKLDKVEEILKILELI